MPRTSSYHRKRALSPGRGLNRGRDGALVHATDVQGLGVEEAGSGSSPPQQFLDGVDAERQSKEQQRLRRGLAHGVMDAS
jgi:hypothetical protein